MAEREGLVFDIQGFSVHDGPGCRTQIFLSGCPLRCEWCSNPEGRELKRQLLFSRQKCRFVKNNCRRCLQACPHGAISLPAAAGGEPLFDHAACRRCETYDCARVCGHEGARVSGVYRSVSEIMHVFRRDRQYWGKDGGASFSGGEPMMQSEFLLDILRECKKEGIHTAIETTACAQAEVFEEIMRRIDFAFIDVKHMDSGRHKAKTGVGNELILGNISRLVSSGWKGRLILRMPVVAGFNDSLENAGETARFMEALGLFEINLLPFHRLGTSKWEQMGMTYAYEHSEGTPPEVMERLQNAYLDRKIACYAGDDVYY